MNLSEPVTVHAALKQTKGVFRFVPPPMKPNSVAGPLPPLLSLAMINKENKKKTNNGMRRSVQGSADG
jgi:hypothetical protein